MIRNIFDRPLASFRLGGQRIALIPSRMKRSGDSFSLALPGGLTAILNLTSPAEDFWHWTVLLRNDGGERTLQITDLCGLDLTFPAEGEVVWESLRGDSCGAASFLPLREALTDGSLIRSEPTGGRSSQETAFPYFDLTDGKRSAVFAIGWTGQWYAETERRGNEIHVKAGFSHCDFYLDPGEEARSCGVLLCCGPRLTETRQAFRRICREKRSPAASTDGRLEIPLSLQVFDRYFRRNPFWASEEGQLTCVRAAGEIGLFNTYWLDAAWFRDGFPTGVGNCDFEPTFPHGLSPVSEAAHRAGMKFMLWFEPERVNAKSDTAREHPEFLLSDGNPANPDFLFNLADDDARAWLFSTLRRLIRENGVDVYRQDANINPLPYWLHNDAPGRTGYLENRYVTGLYRLWDDLLAEFPGLLIDNCSSGGRRLDFEMMRRSVPMWRSDTGCFPPSEEKPTYLWSQNQILGLTRYLPYHACAVWSEEASSVRSAATMGLACNFDVLNPGWTPDRAKLALAEIIALRDLWDGDFYALTPASTEKNVWAAWQLDRDGDGFCAFFRREESPDSRMECSLPAIDTGRMYQVTLRDEDYIKHVSMLHGSALKRFTAEIPSPGGSLILEYHIL